MDQVNVLEAKSNLSKLLKKVESGNTVIICRNNDPVAKLVPFKTINIERKVGLAIGELTMSDDFDKPLDDFIGYM